MVDLLPPLSTLANLIGLALTLSLGLYLVTRTPRSRLAWLAALTLWAVTCFFTYNAMAISLPGGSILPWLRGAAVLALALGFHLILLLPPEKKRRWIDFFFPPLRMPGRIWAAVEGRWPLVCRLAVPLAYDLAIAFIFLGVFPLGIPSDDAQGSAVYLADRIPSKHYYLSILYLLLLGTMAFLHLWQSRRQAAGTGRGRYKALFATVLLSGLGGLYLSLGTWFELEWPSIPGDLTVGLAALIVAYTVADYYAQIEGVAIKRDLFYTALAIGSFTLFYVIVAEVLHLGGNALLDLTLILIIFGAICSLMLYDGLRSTIDRIFYRDQFRQLRANLRALSRETGIGQSLPHRLQAILSLFFAPYELNREQVSAVTEFRSRFSRV